MLAARWKNTTEGIHPFLTFDSRASDAGIAQYGDRIDYVWGSSASQIPKWRAVDPDAILSKYIPFTRDPAPNSSIGKDEHLAWWQANHPELVLYTLFARACDPVLGVLRASGAHSDAQIVDWLVTTCFKGLAG